MDVVLTVTVPLFALILAGFVAGKRQWIDAPSLRGMTGFVFYLAVPVMLFRLMLRAPVGHSFDIRPPLIYGAVMVGLYILSMVIGRLAFHSSPGERAVQGICAAFGNNVYIGLPVAIAVLGEAAALPLALVIIFESMFVLATTVAILEVVTHGRGRALGSALLSGATRVVTNPVVAACVLGTLAGFAGLELPAAVDGLARLLGGAAVPCALFALGVTLAHQPLSERLVETGTLMGLKILAFPALVYVLTGLVMDTDPLWQAAFTIAAAAPTGANPFLVAERYQTYVARASTTVLFSTAVSMLTISALAVRLAR
jgi:malonate transporter and related proteins